MYSRNSEERFEIRIAGNLYFSCMSSLIYRRKSELQIIGAIARDLNRKLNERPLDRDDEEAQVCVMSLV